MDLELRKASTATQFRLKGNVLDKGFITHVLNNLPEE